jgi:hypothetical protein
MAGAAGELGQRLTPVLASGTVDLQAARSPLPGTHADAGGLPASDASVTPLPSQPISSPNAFVQTLHARALPVSPFEAGEVPDVAGANFAYRNPFESDDESEPGFAAADNIPCGLAPASGRTSPEDESPAVLPVAVSAVLPEPSNGGSFQRVDQLEGQFAMMNDIPANSQGASQESSLADTKVLKWSSRLVSSGDTSRSGFGFSKAFSYIARLGDTKSCTVYLANTPEGHFAIKVGSDMPPCYDVCLRCPGCSL